MSKKTNTKTILFYGNFGNKGEPILNGQYSKTIGIFELCKKRFCDSFITFFNTNNFKKHKILNTFKLIKQVKNCDIIVIFPGGIKNLKFIISILRINKKAIVYYPVVGGWLADKIKNSNKLITKLKNFSCIYPETFGLQQKLHNLGIDNTKILPIFSTKTSDSFETIVDNYTSNKSDLIKFVYYGRISEDKGIFKAINAINELNNKYGIKCSIDFYGAFQDQKTEQDLNKQLNDYIKYKGYLQNDLTPLYKYDYYLFPTFYPGEGFPTTCVEAFMCGLPIIASKWAYNEEIVKHEYNGYLFDLKDDLASLIHSIIKKNKNLITLKRNAFDTSKNYCPTTVTEILFKDIETKLIVS